MRHSGESTVPQSLHTTSPSSTFGFFFFFSTSIPPLAALLLIPIPSAPYVLLDEGRSVLDWIRPVAGLITVVEPAPPAVAASSGLPSELVPIE